MSESGGDGGAVPSVLLECLSDPEVGTRRLPAVVGKFDADDELTRLAAAWTCCVVAAEHPDTVTYVVRRLGHRLIAEDGSLELAHALDYLADRYPEQVEMAYADVESESVASDRSRVPRPVTGGFTRAHYYERSPERTGVGRVRLPGGDGTADPRQTYTTGEPDERDVADRRAEAAETVDPGEGRRSGTEADGADDGESERPDDSPGDPVDRANGEQPSDALVGRPSSIASIAERSRFDRIHVLAAREKGRYGVDHRALVGEASEEQAVALRVLARPDEQPARPAFSEQIDESLRRWKRVDDHQNVVTLLDWGVDPRPWLATTFPGETLAEQDLSFDQALNDAITLAGAVAHLHRRDVVHGGIDPKTVVYPGAVLESSNQNPPLLNNVGLLSVYRYHTDPATVLDPRFGAPEYFDRQFGRVDAATDVYQLGATVFAMVTGQPPVTGSFGAVRASVTGPEVPVPSNVRADLPPALDEAVAKATATRKLTRYETVEHFQQDLLAIHDGGAR